MTITFAKKNFLLIHAKINTNVQDFARDTYYFLINFLILALLLVGKLSILTLSFNSPTIILITLFTLFRSNSEFSLTADFVRLIWYSLPLVEKMPSRVYMIKCHSVPVVTIPQIVEIVIPKRLIQSSFLFIGLECTFKCARF